MTESTSSPVQSAPNTTPRAIALLQKIKQARALLTDCRELLCLDLEAVPDDLLQDARGDIHEVREMAGDIFGPIAFQLADNQLAEMADDESVEAAAYENGPGGTGSTGAPASPRNVRAAAADSLVRAYATTMTRIRNQGRETPHDAAFRDAMMARFQKLLALATNEDSEYLEQMEARYRARATELYARVNVMLKFWELPEISGPLLNS